MTRPLGDAGERSAWSSVVALRSMAAELAHNARSFGYGLLAQACSSATNFGLVVLAGHLLGPSGLGTLLIGFAAYMLLLGLQRALLTEPLVAGSSGQEPSERVASSRAAITVALVVSILAACLLGTIGAALPGRLGRGMLLFAAWLVPALVQDVGRSIIFRDRAGRSTVLSDAAWLLTMAATAPFALAWRNDWSVIACWGIGSVAGAGVVLCQLSWRPIRLVRALAWWKLEAWRLGRWLGTQTILYSVASYTTVLLLAGILGARDYGGLRAVQALFAPLTLLAPALALSGLPLVSRLIVDARRQALRVAAQFALLITAVTGVSVVALSAFPDVLVVFFGQKFADFRSIIIPIGLGQLLIAPAFGLTLFLKAEQRGGTILWFGTLIAVVYLALSVVLASAFGLSGAAWAAVGTGATSVVALLFAFRPSMRSL